MYANDCRISRERDLDFNKRCLLPCWARSQNNVKSPLETPKWEKTAHPTNKYKDAGVNGVKLNPRWQIICFSLTVWCWWNWLVYFCIFYVCWPKGMFHVAMKAANWKCVSWTKMRLHYLWLGVFNTELKDKTELLWLLMAALALLYHEGCNNALALKCQEAIK